MSKFNEITETQLRAYIINKIIHDIGTVYIYLKDENRCATGQNSHRLARQKKSQGIFRGYPLFSFFLVRKETVKGFFVPVAYSCNSELL